MLDEILKITQILFYLVGGGVAILTYISAKRGLLNTVNTEYYKKIIEQLHAVSSEIYEEFDEESDRSWGKNDDVKLVVDDINESLSKVKHEFLTGEDVGGGILVAPTEMRLYALQKKYQSDPFLPRKIRIILMKYLGERADVISAAHQNAADYYRDYLRKNPNWENIQHNWHWVHNRVNDELYRKGFGISQVEEKTNAIRVSIQEYLESFDPLSRSAFVVPEWLRIRLRALKAYLAAKTGLAL